MSWLSASRWNVRDLTVLVANRVVLIQQLEYGVYVKEVLDLLTAVTVEVSYVDYKTSNQ